MADKNCPIGVFDSGVGGISVLKCLRTLMPHEDFIYIGDSANAPYGTKSPETVKKLTENSLKKLLCAGVKQAVIACNTATAVAADSLRAEYPNVQIVGIEPAIKPAATENPGGRIAVVATDLTVHQKRIYALYEKYSDTAKIELIPCIGLVELIEGGHLYDEAVFAYLEKLFENRPKYDAYVLGCTHYPLIADAFLRVLGDVKLYDGGKGTAKRSKELLAQAKLLNPQDRLGKTVILNTSNDADLVGFCYDLLS